MDTVDFVIIELENGLTVVEIPRGQDPNEVAARHGGILADPVLYPTYEEACDAMANLSMYDEEEQA